MSECESKSAQRIIRFACKQIHKATGLRRVCFVPLDKDLDFLRRRRAKRSALANQKVWRTFVTLTYDDQHLPSANPSADMREFINRIRNTYPRIRTRLLAESKDIRERAWLLTTPSLRSKDWKLIWRIEYGEVTHRLHIHMMTTGYLPKSLWDYWGKGSRMDLQFIHMNSQQTIAKYISKYISKAQMGLEKCTELPPRSRRYAISRGMNKFIPQWEMAGFLPDSREVAKSQLESDHKHNISRIIQLSESNPSIFDDLQILEIEKQAIECNLLVLDPTSTKVKRKESSFLHNMRWRTDIRIARFEWLESCKFFGPPALPEYQYYSEYRKWEEYKLSCEREADLIDSMTLEPIDPKSIADLPTSVMEGVWLDPLTKQRIEKARQDESMLAEIHVAMFKLKHTMPSSDRTTCTLPTYELDDPDLFE